MTVPLVVLAALAGTGELLNLPFTPDVHVLRALARAGRGRERGAHRRGHGTKVALAIVAMAASFVGIFGAWLVYLRHRVRAIEPAVLAHAWYYDESITALRRRAGHQGLRRPSPGSTATSSTARSTAWPRSSAPAAGGLRTVQSGFVRSYALGISAGVVVVLGYFLTRLYF